MLYRIALVVSELNKNDKYNLYVLVLPPWCYLAHWKEKEGYKKLEWGFFFNTKIIENVIPVIEFSKYEHIFGEYVDFLISFKYKINEKQSKTTSFQKLNYSDCSINHDGYKRICKKNCEYMYSVTYSGFCTTIKSKKSECYEYSYILNNFISVLLSDMFVNYMVSSIFIKNASTILVPFVDQLVKANLEDAVMFHERLIERGNTYIKEVLKTTNYLSAHLRYDDFRQIQSYDVPPIKVSLLKLLYLMLMYKNEKVFISTDEKEEVKKIIAKEFAAYKEYFYFYEDDSYHDGEVAIIDQWICIRSKIFAGNVFSRYSLHIKWERFLTPLGESKNTTLDLCAYNIISNEKKKEHYKTVTNIYNANVIKQIKNVYDKFSEKDKKYINTLCFSSSYNYPSVVSIYRLKYQNGL